MNSEKPWDARLAYCLIYPLRNSRVMPNHLTGLRLVFGILAAAAFAMGDYFWTNAGAVCFVISNFLDHTDGELARLTNRMTEHGHYFDLVCDAIANIILFVGIGIGLAQGQLGFWALPMGLASGISVAGVFHLRNRIEQNIGKLEARQPHYGGFEAEDVLYLLPVVAWMEWLVPFLILASIGAPAFAILVWIEFRAQDTDSRQ